MQTLLPPIGDLRNIEELIHCAFGTYIKLPNAFFELLGGIIEVLILRFDITLTPERRASYMRLAV